MWEEFKENKRKRDERIKAYRDGILIIIIMTLCMIKW